MAVRGSYPHPVIDETDDVESSFEVSNVLADLGQQDIEISYDLRTDDLDLLGLIDRGLAIYSLRWRCSSTISTGDLRPTEIQRSAGRLKLRAWLDQQQVRGDVTFDVRVIVRKSINGLRWSKQHPDYGKSVFNLEPGDVLADGGSFSINAQKLFDPLDPPIGSCFRFVRSTSLRKRIKVSFDGNETVDVQIPAQTFDDFRLLSHRPDLQIALVVLPALIETLSFITRNGDDEPLDDKAWYVAIEAMVDEHGGWDQSLLDLAQKILESPVDEVVRKGIFSAEED